MTRQHILQVSELTRKVRFILESELNTVWLTGEISNFIAASSGHWYLSLKPASALMTTKENLVTVKEGAAREEILGLMHENRIEKILVVDDAFKLVGLITAKDYQKAENKPNACKDELGRLRVGAAVGVGAGTDERIDALVAAGVDVLLIDTSHGHSQGVLDRVKETRDKYPDLQIVAGNVATGAGAKALADAGVDAVKVGIGPGSICTTRIVTGVGVPQLTAISNAVEALKGTDIPVIADGGH